MSSESLERRVRLLTRYAIGSTLLFLLTILAGFRYTTQRFDVIDVERINIVEPDGRVALVLSNAARIPGPVFGGEELPKALSEGRVGSSGLVFYNHDGTESGGLITRTVETEDGYAAIGTLAFDQYNTDQSVQLVYNDDNGRAYAGMIVNDQPAIPLIELVRANEAMQSGSDAEKAAAQALFEQMDVGLHTQRFFAGKDGENALLLLSDRQGRPRIRMMVTAEGTPVMEFMDEQGRLLQRLPDVASK